MTATRSPEHIHHVLEAVRAAWLLHPELRLGQLIVAACDRSAGAGAFHIDDRTLIEALKALGDCNGGPQ